MTDFFFFPSTIILSKLNMRWASLELPVTIKNNPS